MTNKNGDMIKNWSDMFGEITKIGFSFRLWWAGDWGCSLLPEFLL